MAAIKFDGKSDKRLLAAHRLTRMHWNQTLLLFWVAASFIESTIGLSQPKIRVCQNKNCQKRNPFLLQTISQLTHPDQVEKSGCLGHCDDGPNIETIQKDGKSQVINGLIDATSTSVLLGQAMQEDICFPKLLVAASKVMEQVSTIQDLAEKQRFLTSVISKLEASEHRQSTAIAHAFALRAQVSLESGDRSNAIRDAHQAVKLKTVATSGTISLAYRVWADAEEDDTTKVISILQEWRKEQPAYQTKLRKEITELIEKGNL